MLLIAILTVVLTTLMIGGFSYAWAVSELKDAARKRRGMLIGIAVGVYAIVEIVIGCMGHGLMRQASRIEQTVKFSKLAGGASEVEVSRGGITFITFHDDGLVERKTVDHDDSWVSGSILREERTDIDHPIYILSKHGLLVKLLWPYDQDNYYSEFELRGED